MWIVIAEGKLLIHFTDKKIEKKYVNDGNELSDGLIDFICINDIIKIENSDGQKEYLTKWFIKIMDKKLKNYLIIVSI